MTQLFFIGCIILCILSFAIGVYILLKIYAEHIKRLEFMGKKRRKIITKLILLYSSAIIAIAAITIFYMQYIMIGG